MEKFQRRRSGARHTTEWVPGRQTTSPNLATAATAEAIPSVPRPRPAPYQAPERPAATTGHTVLFTALAILIPCVCAFVALYFHKSGQPEKNIQFVSQPPLVGAAAKPAETPSVKNLRASSEAFVGGSDSVLTVPPPSRSGEDADPVIHKAEASLGVSDPRGEKSSGPMAALVPAEPATPLQEARRLVEERQFEAALAVLEKAHAESRDATIAREIAWVLTAHMGSHGKAAARLETLTAAHPEDVELGYLRCASLLSDKQIEPAVAQYRTFRDTFDAEQRTDVDMPFSMVQFAIAAWKTKDRNLAIQLLEESIPKDKGDSKFAWCVNILCMHMIGDAESAAKARGFMTQILDRHPNTPEFLDTLGWCDLVLGKHDDAVALLSRAISLSRNPSADTWERLGDAYIAQGKPPEAAKAYQTAMASGAFRDRLETKIHALGL